MIYFFNLSVTDEQKHVSKPIFPVMMVKYAFASLCGDMTKNKTL